MRSRKLMFAVVTSIAVVAVALIATQVPPLVPMVDTVVGGLLGSLGLYCTGNVVQKRLTKPLQE